MRKICEEIGKIALEIVWQGEGVDVFMDHNGTCVVEKSEKRRRR